VVEGAQAELEHPLRLLLEATDLLDRRAGQPALGLAQVRDVVMEGELFSLVGDDLASSGHSILGPWVQRDGYEGPARTAGSAVVNSDLDYRD
jgi:hypothetical protein